MTEGSHPAGYQQWRSQARAYHLELGINNEPSFETDPEVYEAYQDYLSSYYSTKDLMEQDKPYDFQQDKNQEETGSQEPHYDEAYHGETSFTPSKTIKC